MSQAMECRLPLPDPNSLNAGQRAIYESILTTRGNLEGPFLAWMHSPGLADPAQRLGAFCRYGTELALVESELLILRVARHFDCLGEQQIHEPIAREAGLSEADVIALREGRPPALRNRRQQLLYDASGALLQTNRIPQGLFDELQAEFGTTAVVEIVGVIGYYALVAMTLNAFEMRKADDGEA